ncbi:hypothetical protein EF294_01875 [Gordonia oryzae]|uniref:HTH-like domain-containing protein n=1 Tax=Gordonia oryzae TaxID=2487349 RepID=A0A3N4HGH1_9ACTN|nr:hypothetical protein EF294_01875 [Gordonia oryzae]
MQPRGLCGDEFGRPEILTMTMVSDEQVFDAIYATTRDAGMLTSVPLSAAACSNTRPDSAPTDLSTQKSPALRTIRDPESLAEIRTAPAENLAVYGARKVVAELRRKGLEVARCTVQRLMNAAGLRGIPRSKTRKTTRCEGAETARPADRAQREFAAAAPNALWVADLPVYPHALERTLTRHRCRPLG